MMRLIATHQHFLAWLFMASIALPAAGFGENQAPEGFKPLFTGRDLEGWDGGEVKSPADFEKMSYQDWYDYRNRMTAGLLKHWRVESGELIGTGGGPDLVTWQHYGDVEMWVDWKLKEESEASIGLRYGSPIKFSTLSEKGAVKHIGQWNRMYVRIVGPYVKVVLNGKTVLDNVILENVTDPGRPIERAGPIHLQVAKGRVHFRNISIREMPAQESNELLDEIAGDEDEFVSLFNGKDLTGWEGALKGHEVVDGTIRCRRKDFGNIQTVKQYSNFIARMEFKLPPGSNNGLLIRTPNTNPTHTRDTLEIQILDDNHIMHKHLGPSQYHGSAYGFAPAIRGYLRPTGQWNHQEIYVQDDHIKVKLNGYLILDARLKKISPDHPAASTKCGHFGLCGYSDPVAFRNLRIKEIE